MRILFVVHNSSLYGATRSLLELAIILRKLHKTDIHFVLPRKGELATLLDDNGFEYSVAGFSLNVSKKEFRKNKTKTFLLRFLKTPLWVFRICRIIYKTNAELVYTNTSTIYYGFFAALICKRPHVWHIREYGKHDYDYDYDYSFDFLKFLISKSKAIIFVSNHLKGFYNIKSNSQHVVWNGLFQVNELQTIRSQNHFQIKGSNDTFILIVLGAIQKGKGQLDIVRAVQYANSIRQHHHPKISLEIYGNVTESEYGARLKEQIGNDESIKIFEFIKDVSTVYRRADAVVNASDYEGFGRTIIEAQAYGKVIFVKSSGTCNELVKDGVNGLHFSSIENLASQILELSERDDKRLELISNGYHFLDRYNNMELTSEKIYLLLSQVCKY